ncbi:hypothetical protein CDL15_Pgr017604 [Punica granatum]|uniref:Uncharacterized protein n=1 Tax=Punica granatum TaxID=22663 RepID=A0A218W5W7_PUNGR|nr:hypothetical protein CDL15_Pgr017604 [Punica granatum]
MPLGSGLNISRASVERSSVRLRKLLEMSLLWAAQRALQWQQRHDNSLGVRGRSRQWHGNLERSRKDGTIAAASRVARGARGRRTATQ